MIDPVLSFSDGMYILATSFGQAFGLWFFFNQYLKPRFRMPVALIAYTLLTVATVLTYDDTPVEIRSFTTPLLIFVLALCLYRKTVMRTAVIVALSQLITMFLELLLFAGTEILKIPYAQWHNNRIFIFVVTTVLFNALIIPFSYLLIPLLKPRRDFDPQNMANLTGIFVILFVSVSCLGAITVITISYDDFSACAAICAGIVLLLSGVMFLLWILRQIELVSRKESERILLKKEYEYAVQSDARTAEYRREVETLESAMSGKLADIADCIGKQQIGQAIACIDQNLAETQKIKRPQEQKNPVADYFLAEMKIRCASKNIEALTEIELPHSAGIDDLDFSTILSNMLDNAVKACEKVKEKRYIRLNIHKNGNILFIGCENSKSTVSQKSGSERKIGHFGLINIRQSANKYGGTVEISEKPDSFLIEVLLYC